MAVGGLGFDGLVSVYEVISRLPEITVVRDRSRAMAMLDAIMSPEWDARYYSFDSAWSPAEEMASMRDGSGNEYSIVFSAAGAYARGFDHESPMSPYRVSPSVSWPGLLDTVPEVFRSCVEEPAFSDPDGAVRATVVFWRETSDFEWRSGNVEVSDRDQMDADADADGAERLFDVLADGRPEAYQLHAEEYCEVKMHLDAVRHVYALRPLTQSVVSALNPDVMLGDLAEDIVQVGYTTGGSLIG